MKLVPVSDSTVLERVQQNTRHKLQNIILEFMESSMEMSLVQVNPDEYSHMGSLSCGLRRAVKNLKVNVKVVQDRNKVYLVKEK